jgi:hypothetical protein
VHLANMGVNIETSEPLGFLGHVNTVRQITN